MSEPSPLNHEDVLASLAAWEDKENANKPVVGEVRIISQGGKKVKPNQPKLVVEPKPKEKFRKNENTYVVVFLAVAFAFAYGAGTFMKTKDGDFNFNAFKWAVVGCVAIAISVLKIGEYRHQKAEEAKEAAIREAAKARRAPKA